MRSKVQILKDNGLAGSAAVIKPQRRVYHDWDSILINMRANQLSTSLRAAKIYELAITAHGITCKCCDRIPRESITCPTSQERLERKHTPGRPCLKR